MKLTMKNDYSFQKAEGYLDDPDTMSVDEVKKQLSYWHDLLEAMDANAKLPSDLVHLSSFIESLANGEIEYTNPLQEFEYGMAFEYYHRFKVTAKSQEEADEIAKCLGLSNEQLFRRVAEPYGKNIYRLDDGEYVYES